MSENEKIGQEEEHSFSGRRGFFFTVLGGAVAALTGWISGAFPREVGPAQEDDPGASLAETRISALEARVAELTDELVAIRGFRPLGEIEGEGNEQRVVFNKRELTLNNPEGVLLNLVATNRHVGIRFYKDFGFGNEQVTNPWSMGWIEGKEGYQGLAILRDWRFTAALWDEDGRLLSGSLDPHPPANEPARARLHVRGRLDEVQTIVEASRDQAADILQVVGRRGSAHMTVDSTGNLVVGSEDDPRAIVLRDTQDKRAYSLKVTNGQLTLTKA